MSSTAAPLAHLLELKADRNYYTQQQIYWANKYDANSAKLSKQMKYEEAFETAYDNAFNNTRELSATHGGKTVVVGAENTCEELAEEYAQTKVHEYDEELSLELADLDLEYDTMKTMYETQLEQLSAEIENVTSLVSQGAQDTGMIQS